jgi:hypothetical protein
VFSSEDGCFLKDPFSHETVAVPALSRARLHQMGDESSDESSDGYSDESGDDTEAEHEWMKKGEGKLPDAHKIQL